MKAKVFYDKDSSRSRGFGFVTYSSADEVYSAVESLDSVDLDGRNITSTRTLTLNNLVCNALTLLSQKVCWEFLILDHSTLTTSKRKVMLRPKLQQQKYSLRNVGTNRSRRRVKFSNRCSKLYIEL